MKAKQATPVGYSTVCPFLMLDDIEKEISFLVDVFNAGVKERLKGPDGNPQHAEVRIGECVIMMGRRRKDFPSQGMTYVFVSDTDAVYQKALLAGATSLMEPGDRFYGLREAGFADAEGNQWWIANAIEEISPEDMQKRASSENGFIS